MQIEDNFAQTDSKYTSLKISANFICASLVFFPCACFFIPLEHNAECDADYHPERYKLDYNKVLKMPCSEHSLIL